jgi:tRNA modification GTPase
MHASLENAGSKTIVAQATPSGKGALSILRVSGEGVRPLIQSLCKKGEQVLKEERKQVYTPLLSETGLHSEKTVLDYALACFFPGPNSFTGEDVLELSLHGSSVVVREVLREIYSRGIVPAEAGEFTKRAFLNGKLDLAQAEAVADLISSETEAQARIAKEQLEGKLSNALTLLGEPLRNLLAEIEAYIDFPDEDISPATSKEWERVTDGVLTNIEAYIRSFSKGKVLREGASLALAGIPNAGKSSLMNHLLGEERAIVTDIAGTTRDSIEERLELEGVLFRVWDTAGIVDEADFNEKNIHLPEQLGIKRSWKLIEQADLVLFLFDVENDLMAQRALLSGIEEKNPRCFVLVTKSDLHSRIDEMLHTVIGHERVFPVSSKTGEGIDILIKEILSNVCGEGDSNEVLISNERHFLVLRDAREILSRTIEAIHLGQPTEYIAFEIRQVLTSLQEIVGVTSTEDILGRIFSKFCIGK